MERNPSRFSAILAAAAVPLAAGAALGAVDAGLAALAGAPPSPAFFGLAASLGASLALAMLAPILVVSLASRRGAFGLAFAAVASAAFPPVFWLARSLYKRLPWSALDAVLALAAAAGAALLVLAASGALAKRLEGRSGGVIRLLSRAALPLALLAVPALVRAIPAVRGELAARRAAAAASLGVSADFAPATRAPRGTPQDAPLDTPRSALLLLSIDTMRADRLGSAGDPDLRTPHLDRLARASTQFSNCRTVSPWTLPSLATLLTGTYPGEHRMLEELTALADSVPDLAEILRAEGMRTGAFVSNPWLATGSLQRGFDAFDVAERLESFATLSPTRLYRALSKTLLRTARLDEGDHVSGRGIAWIADAEKDGASWFAWLHYFDPHLPNWPRPPLDRLGGPPPSHFGASITVEEIRRGAYTGGEEGRREIVRLYDAEVAATDRAVGRVLRALEKSGRLDDAVVILTADHGEEFWEHGGYGHGHSMFDEVLRVPLFVRGPGIPAGRIDARSARLLDVAPTAVAALGLSAPATPRGFTGRNLFSGEAPADTTYGEATLYGPERKLLLAGSSKLVWVPGAERADSALQLFDLEGDPAERRDLAGTPGAGADSLFARLVEWKHRVGSDRTTTSANLPEGIDPAVRDQLEALGYID